MTGWGCRWIRKWTPSRWLFNHTHWKCWDQRRMRTPMMTTTWATTLPLSPTNWKPLIFNKDRVSQSSFLFFSSCHRAQPRVHSGSLHAAWVVSVLLRTKDNEKMNATISSAIETLSGSLGSLSSSLDTLTAYVDQVVVCVMLFP